MRFFVANIETKNIQYANLNAKAAFAKEEVEIHIESLKLELDTIRERLLKDIDDNLEELK